MKESFPESGFPILPTRCILDVLNRPNAAPIKLKMHVFVLKKQKTVIMFEAHNGIQLDESAPKTSKPNFTELQLIEN